MSVFSVTPPSRWSGSFKLERGRRNYRATFIVVTDNPTDGPNVVRSGLGVPRIGDQYLPTPGDADPFAFCVSVDPRQRPEDPFTWDVDVEYSTVQRELTPGDPADAADPTLRPAEISWSTQRRALPAFRDVVGRAVVTSAGNSFAEPVVIDDDLPVLTITRNELIYDEGLSFLYRNAVNTDPFLGVGPRQAKVLSITARTFQEGLVTWWKVTRSFMFKLETFDRRILDQDYRDKDMKPFVNPKTSNPYSTPTLLDGLGGNLLDANTTLSQGVNASDTTLHVASVDPFPFDLVLNDYTVEIDGLEECFVTGVAVGELTVVRGYAGTAKVAHGSGVKVQMRPCYRRFRLSKELPFAIFQIF